jgi:hypothetical protein
MKNPTLAELPPAPPSRTGWPWTEATPQLPDVMPDGCDWPRITVVTPSYNQGQFIEETIRSILLQGYPNLEYVIMDGGSTDESIEVIKKYDPWITRWVSQRDDGQANAINLGFRKSTGSLLGWINSDDTLLPGALHRLAEAHKGHPGHILLADTVYLTQGTQGSKRSLRRQHGVTLANMVDFWNHRGFWSQPGTWVPRELCRQVGELDESLRYVFDRDFMCRLLMISSVSYVHYPIAMFRLHAASKTVAENSLWGPEQVAVTRRYQSSIPRANGQLVEAVVLQQASAPYLGIDHRDRSKGLQLLRQAVSKDKRVVFVPGFVPLFVRALVPTGVIKAAKIAKTSMSKTVFSLLRDHE